MDDDPSRPLVWDLWVVGYVLNELQVCRRKSLEENTRAYDSHILSIHHSLFGFSELLKKTLSSDVNWICASVTWYLRRQTGWARYPLQPLRSVFGRWCQCLLLEKGLCIIKPGPLPLPLPHSLFSQQNKGSLWNMIDGAFWWHIWCQMERQRVGLCRFLCVCRAQHIKY